MTKKAVFFDRDDTLIQDENYMHKPEQLVFFEKTFSTLKELQKRDYLLFIVTNQSGIGRGYFTIDDMHNFHRHMLSELKKESIQISKIAYCPHAPDEGCDCRKPHPKLLLELIDEFNIDVTKSFMVGDKKSDVEAGLNANLKSIGINVEASHSINSIEEVLKIIP